MPGATPSQTVGPFFHGALAWPGATTLAGPEAAGERIGIAGRVLDGDGMGVPDALVEVWQADAAGRYPGAVGADPAVLGFGRCATGPSGDFAFSTIRPGPVAGPGGALQAPHLVVGLFGRGLLRRLVTRIYFEDAAENGADPVLALVPTDRRGTLLARRTGAGVYRFDVVLQGEGETVFLEFPKGGHPCA